MLRFVQFSLVALVFLFEAGATEIEVIAPPKKGQAVVAGASRPLTTVAFIPKKL